MTRDFLEDFTDACQKEGVAFVVIVQAKDGESAFVRAALDNWKLKRDCTKTEDIMQLIESCELDG